MESQAGWLQISGVGPASHGCDAPGEIQTRSLSMAVASPERWAFRVSCLPRSASIGEGAAVQGVGASSGEYPDRPVRGGGTEGSALSGGGLRHLQAEGRAEQDQFLAW